MKYITSVHNDQIRHIIDLQNKAYRIKHQEFVAEGTRACSQLLTTFRPVEIYMTETYYQTHTLHEYHDLIICVADHVMAKMSSSKTPSGICATFRIPKPLPLPQTGPGLILVDISDPGNLGTLIRTAAAMNIKEIILIGGVDPYNPKVVQSTAGCLNYVHLYQATFEEVVAHKNIQLCALVVQGGKHPEALDLKNKFLVVGNEAHGLLDQQIKACPNKMTIPMPGHAESLNAAIAGAIGLYCMIATNK